MGDLSNKFVVVAESVGGTWWLMPDGSDTTDALLAGVFDETKARQLAATHQGFLARPAREVLCGPTGSLGAALRDVERAFLVHEVGLTLEQADDAQVDQRLLGMPRITPGVYVEVDAPARAVTGDIDRNGAASMLPGIIESLEQRGIAALSDDEIIEKGVSEVEAGPKPGAPTYPAAGFGGKPQLGLTALKLLQRARAAEDAARLSMAFGMQENGAAIRAYEQVERQHALLSKDRMAPSIDPTVAALAVVDDLEASSVLKIAPVDLAERLANVIASTRRDIRPENPWPLWCAFEAADSEHRFHGPFAAEGAAEIEAAALRSEGYEVAVRRCRQVRASESVADHVLDSIVDRLNDDPCDITDVGGAVTYGNWDEPIACATVRNNADLRALDGLIKIKLWLIEPEGARP